MKRKKKKGRPAKTQIPVSAPRNPIILGSPPITYSRSHRRNPKYFTIPTDFDGADDDDDERKEKKVKLVVRLPESNDTPAIDQNQPQKKKAEAHSGGRAPASPSSESEPEPGDASASEPDSAEDRDARAKKRKINAVDRGSDGPGSTQEKKEVKVTDTQQHGSPLEAGPTSTLPDKKLLVFILDRLQKKDTYGVFSEPVDINELPDYFEVIEKPMDFGSVRKKLDRGAYKKLEELEADVFLICSNAMLYNAPDTVYYRQARSIQEIAKRDFENLRHEGDNGEPQPKVVRRGRPPSSKNQKKSLETSPIDRVGADLSSGAALTNTEDKATGSNTYNLRKGPALYRYRDPYLSSYKPRNGENHSELMGDWNNEFPASILRADMKYGKKQLTVDENRRDTYRQYHPLSSPNNPSSFTNSMGDMKRLVTVGLHEPFAYARSLARFAANLGPVAWKVASKRIEYALPPGTGYGPGWVSEAGASSSSQPPSFPNNPNLDSRTPEQPSSSLPHGLSEEMIEAVRRLNSQNERGLQGDLSPWKTPFPQIQQNHMYQSQIQPPIQPQMQLQMQPQIQPQMQPQIQPQMQPQIQLQIQNLNQVQTQIPRNGFSGMLGFSAMEGFQFPTQNMNNPMLSNYSPAVQEEAKLQEMLASPSLLRQQVDMSTALPRQQGEMWAFGRSPWPAVPAQHGRSLAGPPDLNLRIPAGSPSSSLQIGSPQPDLALQL